MANQTETAHQLGARVAKQLVLTFVLTLVVVAVMVAVYSVAPEPDGTWSNWQFIVFGTLCLAGYLGLIVASLRPLPRSSHPFIDGALFVVVLATVMILSYSWMYLSLSNANPNSFTEVLDKPTAVYFTVTVLSTVGFGDITPSLQTPRMVTMSQMLLGFTLFTIAIRAVTQTARQAIHNQRRSAGANPPDYVAD